MEDGKLTKEERMAEGGWQQWRRNGGGGRREQLLGLERD